MLTATPIQGPAGLGQDANTTITADEQARIPQYVSILQQIKNAEDDTLAAYTNIATLTATVGNQAKLPVALLSEYNRGIDMIRGAATDWFEAQDRAGNPVVPTYPPRFAVSAPVSGPGAMKEVAASQVTVIYGPQGSEQTAPLGDSRISFPMPGEISGALGFAPVGFVIIILAVVLMTLGIVLLVREWDRAEVETARARAREAEAHAKQVRLATEALLKLYASCAGDSTDETHKLQCLDKSVAGIKGVIKALPETKGPGGSGRGFFGTLGLIVFVGAVGYGGWYLYQRKKRRTGMARTGRMAARRNQVTPLV